MGSMGADTRVYEPNTPLRFVVEAVDGRRSASWRMWTAPNSDDIYLAERSTAAAHKVPLHESGDWRIAMTDKHAERLGISRVIHTQWDRPGQEIPGQIYGPAILACDSDLRYGGDRLPEGTIKVEMAPSRDAVVIRILIIGGEPDMVSLDRGECIGLLRRAKGGTVVAAAQSFTLPAETFPTLESIRQDARRFADERGVPWTGQRIVGVMALPGGPRRSLVDLVL